jgi:hypothetical protein
MYIILHSCKSVHIQFILRTLALGTQLLNVTHLLSATPVCAPAVSQEHVGEYGVHWNFFLTSACVTLLTHVIPLDQDTLAPAGVSVLILHQSILAAGSDALPLNTATRMLPAPRFHDRCFCLILTCMMAAGACSLLVCKVSFLSSFLSKPVTSHFS